MGTQIQHMQETKEIDHSLVQGLGATESQDFKVVNLAEFPLNQHHISLLKRGLSFSSRSSMNGFEVYKDVSLFPRKVIFRYWHNNRRNTQIINQSSKKEEEAL